MNGTLGDLDQVKDIKEITGAFSLQQIGSARDGKVKSYAYILGEKTNQKTAAGPTKKLLVLDLAETLIHVRLTKSLDCPSSALTVIVNKQLIQVYIAERPNLQKFLSKLSKLFDIWVYSDNPKEVKYFPFHLTRDKYCRAAVKFINKNGYIEGFLSKDNCVKFSQENPYLLKDITLFNRDLKDVILVDKDKNQTKLQPDNVLVIKKFNGDRDDDELERILPFLEELSKQEDVRKVSKKYLKYFEKSSKKEPATRNKEHRVTSHLPVAEREVLFARKHSRALETEDMQERNTPTSEIKQSPFANLKSDKQKLNARSRQTTPEEPPAELDEQKPNIELLPRLRIHVKSEIPKKIHSVRAEK